MKQHLTEINGRPLLFVEAQEGDYNFKLNPFNNGILSDNDDSEAPFQSIIRIPPGNWQLYGSPFSLSEEKAKELVPRFKMLNGGEYRNYVGRPDILLKNALESWQSFLESEKVFKENPINKDKPVTVIGHKGSEKIAELLLQRFQDKWQEAEQRVFRNAVLLVEEKKNG